MNEFGPIERAEQAVAIMLYRWQEEVHPEQPETATRIDSVHSDDIRHCLLDFEIDHVDRMPAIHRGDHEAALMPVRQAFAVHVTLDVCDRPCHGSTLEEVRSNPVNRQTLRRVYNVREMEDRSWLVLDSRL